MEEEKRRERGKKGKNIPSRIPFSFFASFSP
jgi:hypothetical protein